MGDTVCIAATCWHRRQRLFGILCSDSRIEFDQLGSADTGPKTVSIAPGMSAMFAASVSASKELIDRYIKHLNDPKTKRTPDNALAVLAEPLEQQTRSAAYLSASYGMRYAEYLKLNGESQRSLMLDFAPWGHRSQLIIVWLGPQFARLFLVANRVEEVRCLLRLDLGRG